jgi:hypothetical protein
MTSENEPSYVGYKIVAVRFAGESRRQLVATDKPVLEFGNDLMAKWRIKADIREVTGGAVRVEPGAEFDPNKIEYHGVEGVGWTWDEIAASWRAPEENITPPASVPVVANEIQVEFGTPDAGWLRVQIAASGMKAELHASHL